MRCEDLTRELASPTGALTQAEMAGHLAACPACAEWSRRASQLDRIWEATRPADPSMVALDALWAHASAELDARQAVPATLKFTSPARSRRRLAVIGFVSAQAAAILVAALVLLAREGARPTAVAVRPAAEEPIFLDLPVGDDQIAVVRIGGRDEAPKVDLQDLSRLFASPALPAFTPHDEFDKMEAQAASLDIASK